MILIAIILLIVVVLFRRINKSKIIGEDKIEAVRHMFPHYNAEDIRRDLMVTNSVQLTIENIIEGRLVQTVVAQPAQIVNSTIKQRKVEVEITNPELLRRKDIMLDDCRRSFLMKHGSVASKPKLE